MMTFDEFLDEALVAGSGRKAGGVRSIPAFVPAGEAQDLLFDQSLAELALKNFRLFDVRGPDGYRKALGSFALGWPLCMGPAQRPGDLYLAETPEDVRYLLIVCGPQRMPRFWQHLRKSSALHIGAVFPPFIHGTTGPLLHRAGRGAHVRAGEREGLPGHPRRYAGADAVLYDPQVEAAWIANRPLDIGPPMARSCAGATRRNPASDQETDS
ncbi:MAG: hypothetical protein QME60_08800 [Verrucomicrobiota bacterium]|nr:hypothetical protein [Verrucomicrobiota bacterium]